MPAPRGPALILAPKGNPGLTGSYGRALEKRMRVEYWNLGSAIERNVKYQRFGKVLNTYFPFEPWVLGGNRELIVHARKIEPSFVMLAGALPIRAGALAQIKAALPATKLVLMWPDTLLNLSGNVVECLPVFDLVGSYSTAAIPLLERLGARKVAFLPFAADLELFPSEVELSPDAQRELESDVCFVGNHRPEREEAVLQLLDAGLRVKVWGTPDWVRRSGAPQRVSSYFQGKPLFGADLVRAVRASKISLNVIDPTNFPAANMRFFESFACRRVSLSSPCPEMLDEFPNDVSCAYYGEGDLVARARALVADATTRDALAARAFERVVAGHTYEHRARRLLELLDIDA